MKRNLFAATLLLAATAGAQEKMPPAWPAIAPHVHFDAGNAARIDKDKILSLVEEFRDGLAALYTDLAQREASLAATANNPALRQSAMAALANDGNLRLWRLMNQFRARAGLPLAEDYMRPVTSMPLGTRPDKNFEMLLNGVSRRAGIYVTIEPGAGAQLRMPAFTFYKGDPPAKIPVPDMLRKLFDDTDFAPAFDTLVDKRITHLSEARFRVQATYALGPRMLVTAGWIDRLDRAGPVFYNLDAIDARARMFGITPEAALAKTRLHETMHVLQRGRCEMVRPGTVVRGIAMDRAGQLGEANAELSAKAALGLYGGIQMGQLNADRISTQSARYALYHAMYKEPASSADLRNQARTALDEIATVFKSRCITGAQFSQG